MLAASILAVGCKKARYETPEAALAALQQAYLKKDAAAFVAVLSNETLAELEEKVSEIRATFQTAPENPHAAQAFEHMAQQMGLSVSKLRELTLEDFIRYMMQNEQASGSETTLLPPEVLPPATVQKKSEKGNRAVLYFAEGHKLSFIKTSEGWKVHLDTDSVAGKLPLSEDE